MGKNAKSKGKTEKRDEKINSKLMQKFKSGDCKKQSSTNPQIIISDQVETMLIKRLLLIWNERNQINKIHIENSNQFLFEISKDFLGIKNINNNNNSEILSESENSSSLSSDDIIEEINDCLIEDDSHNLNDVFSDDGVSEDSKSLSSSNSIADSIDDNDDYAEEINDNGN